ALVMARPGGHMDPKYLREVIEREEITTLHFVPSMLESFLEQGGWRGCENVSLVISSGESLPRSLVERFYEEGGVGLNNLYGPTETAIDVTHRPCEGGEDGMRVPIGRPIANTNMYVVAGSSQLAPPGVSGELWIGGV